MFCLLCNELSQFHCSVLLLADQVSKSVRFGAISPMMDLRTNVWVKNPVKPNNAMRNYAQVRN